MRIMNYSITDSIRNCGISKCIMSFKQCFLCSIYLNGNYIPRGRTVLHTILDKHFNDFVENYDVQYAEECGKYSLERISSVVEEYLKCGDYKQGIARVKCINPECKHGRFRTSLSFAVPVQSMYIGHLLRFLRSKISCSTQYKALRNCTVFRYLT